jgi:hypothetical protein
LVQDELIIFVPLLHQLQFFTWWNFS